MSKINLIGEGKITVGKIVCVGRNYVKHAEELGNSIPEFPLIFLKPASVLIHSEDKIVHPDYSNELHYEGELVLLITQSIKNADGVTAENSIGGYAIGLDMTLRDIQNELKKKGHPWTLAKCFDGSAIVSDFIPKKQYRLTLNETLSLSVNGQIKQKALLKNMIFSPAEIVKYISSKMTLEKGDIIFTGTPSGVGKVVAGDKIEAGITNVGKLFTEIS
jgi:5-carboxymethyl-2-hydroxymuconate isomerase